MKKLQVAVLVIALLAVIGGMNYYDGLRRDEAAKLAKEAKAAEEKAEREKAAKLAPKGEAAQGPALFPLPKSSGPQDAPVKLDIYVNNSKDCHEGSVSMLNPLQHTYGKLLRVEWHNVHDPKLAKQIESLKIACEAGLVINGKVEQVVESNGGKTLVSFRGPVGEKYKIDEVYGAINGCLIAKGKKPPALALEKAKSASAPPVQTH